MAKLTDLGFQAPKAEDIRFIGFEVSTIENSDGQLYTIGKLKQPITVRCSMDPSIVMEENELLLSPEVMDSNDWAGTPEEGSFIPKFVADYSTTHLKGIYQSTTIKKWIQGKRKGEKTEKDNNLKTKLEAIRAQRLALKS